MQKDTKTKKRTMKKLSIFAAASLFLLASCTGATKQNGGTTEDVTDSTTVIETTDSVAVQETDSTEVVQSEQDTTKV